MINNETIDNIKLEKNLENSWKQYSDFLSDTNNREDILNSLNFSSIFVNNITDTFDNANGMTNKMGDTKQVINNNLIINCKPPNINDSIAIYLLNTNFDIFFKEKNIKQEIQEIEEEDIKNNYFIKFFWTGWDKLTQLLACKMAKDITIKYCEELDNNNRTCGARAVELTNLSASFLNLYGNWNQELPIFENFFKRKIDENNKILVNQKWYQEMEQELKNTNEIENIVSELYDREGDVPINMNIEEMKKFIMYRIAAVAVRKNIWDTMSIIYAKYKKENKKTISIIVLPKNISKSSDPNFLKKTLMALELPNMYCDFFTIILFDSDNKKQTNNKNLSLFNLNNIITWTYDEVELKDNDIKLNLNLFKFNDNIKNQLINYLTSLYNEEINIPVSKRINKFEHKEPGGGGIKKEYKKTKKHLKKRKKHLKKTKKNEKSKKNDKSKKNI